MVIGARSQRAVRPELIGEADHAVLDQRAGRADGSGEVGAVVCERDQSLTCLRPVPVMQMPNRSLELVDSLAAEASTECLRCDRSIIGLAFELAGDAARRWAVHERHSGRPGQAGMRFVLKYGARNSAFVKSSYLAPAPPHESPAGAVPRPCRLRRDTGSCAGARLARNPGGRGIFQEPAGSVGRPERRNHANAAPRQTARQHMSSGYDAMTATYG